MWLAKIKDCCAENRKFLVISGSALAIIFTLGILICSVDIFDLNNQSSIASVNGHDFLLAPVIQACGNVSLACGQAFTVMLSKISLVSKPIIIAVAVIFLALIATAIVLCVVFIPKRTDDNLILEEAVEEIDEDPEIIIENRDDPSPPNLLPYFIVVPLVLVAILIILAIFGYRHYSKKSYWDLSRRNNNAIELDENPDIEWTPLINMEERSYPDEVIIKKQPKTDAELERERERGMEREITLLSERIYRDSDAISKIWKKYAGAGKPEWVSINLHKAKGSEKRLPPEILTIPSKYASIAYVNALRFQNECIWQEIDFLPKFSKKPEKGLFDVTQGELDSYIKEVSTFAISFNLDFPVIDPWKVQPHLYPLRLDKVTEKDKDKVLAFLKDVRQAQLALTYVAKSQLAAKEIRDAWNRKHPNETISLDKLIMPDVRSPEDNARHHQVLRWLDNPGQILVRKQSEDKRVMFEVACLDNPASLKTINVMVLEEGVQKIDALKKEFIALKSKEDSTLSSASLSTSGSTVQSAKKPK
jgi:hypothetical protein